MYFFFFQKSKYKISNVASRCDFLKTVIMYVHILPFKKKSSISTVLLEYLLDTLTLSHYGSVSKF